MDSQKKDPLYKSFGYAFEGIGTCIKKERNMKIRLCGSDSGSDCRSDIEDLIAGMVHLPDTFWAYHGAGAGQYRSRSGGRSGDGRAEATCKDCKRYSSRCGSDCSNYGSDRRDYYFSAKGAYIPWVLKQIEIVKGDRRYGKFRRWS